MKPIWLIEKGVWKDDIASRMADCLREQGQVVHVEEYTYLGGTEFDVIGENQPVIFYGSLNTANYLRLMKRNWVPLIWYDETAFSCRTYYAHWGKHQLQEHYAFLPLAELPRMKDKLFQTFGSDGTLFIRPDENDKSFAGRLVTAERFAQWYQELQTDKLDPTTLVVVSAPVPIDAEWRFVIADRKVIAGSAYRAGGKLQDPGQHLKSALHLATAIATEPWQPRAIYCADIAYCGSNRYRLVEIGGINSAGLYRCKLPPIIEAMNAIAVREFRHWKGQSQ